MSEQRSGEPVVGHLNRGKPEPVDDSRACTRGGRRRVDLTPAPLPVALGLAPLGLAALGLAALGLAALGLAASAASLRAQELAELTETPEAAAELFLRSVRAIRWSTAAQLAHPETLARFSTMMRMFAAADTTGEVSRYLTGTDSAGLLELTPSEVFTRSVGATIDGLPGLMHALYDRDDEVLGHVAEGDATAHVVYRTTARISGAVPEVKVMHLERVAERGWRILWSDELEVLEAALRGVAR